MQPHQTKLHLSNITCVPLLHRHQTYSIFNTRLSPKQYASCSAAEISDKRHKTRHARTKKRLKSPCTPAHSDQFCTLSLIQGTSKDTDQLG